jgi:hypothetical protein
MYMLMLKICSEHALIFRMSIVDPTFDHIKSLSTGMKRIIISNDSYNKMCDEYRVDIFLPLNTIDELLITRLLDVKRIHYKDPSHLHTYHC